MGTKAVFTWPKSPMRNIGQQDSTARIPARQPGRFIHRPRSLTTESHVQMSVDFEYATPTFVNLTLKFLKESQSVK